MNYHIVRVNEKLEKIANIYNLKIIEIIDINHHIKDWNNLVPGTKLRLPEIPSIVEEELDNTEPFIEEYYPKIEPTEFIKPTVESSEVKEEIVEIPIEQSKVNEPLKKYPTYNPYMPPYPYYGYYGNYYYNPYHRNRKTTRKKK